jgi:CheY-like chemotaxis protein
VLLVDDEEEVRKVLAQHLTRHGYTVAEAESPDAAIKKVNGLAKAGPFIVITDLGMPTSGGSSFQGGFEVVKRLGKMGHHPPVLMMTENLTGAIQARAKQMGIAHFIFKPGLSKLDHQQFEADLRAFARTLVADILPRLVPRAPSSAAPGGSSLQPQEKPRAVDDLIRSFPELTSHLEALANAADTGQISLLVMKAAREFFERGALFLVKNDLVRGLGGFGTAPGPEKLSLLVREVVVSLGEPSVFLEVVDTRKPVYGNVSDERWAGPLVSRIGRFKASEAVLIPLLTNRETIALLYGDNPDTGRELSRVEALEAFVNQAGIALENIFLQNKDA